METSVFIQVQSHGYIEVKQLVQKKKVQVKTNQALLALTNDSVLHVGYWAIIQFGVRGDATYGRCSYPISLEASLI